MSQTIDTFAFNIRRMIGDTDMAHPVIDTPFTLIPAIVRNANLLANEAGVGTVWAASYFTSVAGSAADLVLPAVGSTIPFQSIIDVRDTARGHILDRKQRTEIDAMREGVIGTGIPLAYALWEDAGQVATLRFECKPQGATAYDVCYRPVPLYTNDPNTSLDFSPTMIAAVEYAVAAELAPRMPGIPDKTIEGWLAKSAYAIKQEKVRQARMKRGPIFAGAMTGF